MLLGQLSLQELAKHLCSLGIDLQTGPFTVRICGSIPNLANSIQFLYTDFSLDESGFADFFVRIDRSTGFRRLFHPQARFLFEDSMPFSPLPLKLAMPFFEWGFNWCIARQHQRFLTIHSAALELNNQAFLFIAPPGSGKSTLTAALAFRGWRLLTDELTLVDPSDGQIVPLPRPVSLKNNSIDIIKKFAPDAHISQVYPDTQKGTIAHLRPPRSSVTESDRPSMPTRIFFSKYQHGASAQLEPVSKARAFLRVADNSFNYSLLGATGFKTIAHLVDRCECAEFIYSDLDEAVGFLNLAAAQ